AYFTRGFMRESPVCGSVPRAHFTPGETILAARRKPLAYVSVTCSLRRVISRPLACAYNRLPMPQTPDGVAAALAEIRELKATISTLRDELERERATREDAVRRAQVLREDELRQVKETAATLRETLESERSEIERRVRAAVAAADDEIA